MNYLDINTPRGQRSLEYERHMMEKIEHEMDIQLIETDKSTDARCDGIMVSNNKLIGVFESKCRNMTLEDLQRFGSWLVTHEKISDGQTVSRLLRIQFCGFLYLIPDDMILMWPITDNKGDYNFDFESKKTETQETINGGKVVRKNSFLPFDESVWIYGDGN
tara:strand:- start:934 stop:1419 length:486 start_codon:yes stop_codon:yes gene_type:complete